MGFLAGAVTARLMHATRHSMCDTRTGVLVTWDAQGMQRKACMQNFRGEIRIRASDPPGVRESANANVLEKCARILLAAPHVSECSSFDFLMFYRMHAASRTRPWKDDVQQKIQD